MISVRPPDSEAHFGFGHSAWRAHGRRSVATSGRLRARPRRRRDQLRTLEQAAHRMANDDAQDLTVSSHRAQDDAGSFDAAERSRNEIRTSITRGPARAAPKGLCVGAERIAKARATRQWTRDGKGHIICAGCRGLAPMRARGSTPTWHGHEPQFQSSRACVRRLLTRPAGTSMIAISVLSCSRRSLLRSSSRARAMSSPSRW